MCISPYMDHSLVVVKGNGQLDEALSHAMQATLQGEETSPSQRKSTLSVHWKD